MLLEDFDESRKAVVEPELMVEKNPKLPEIAVTCFSGRTFHSMREALNAEPVSEMDGKSLAGRIYIANYRDERVLLYRSPMGAPACVAALEELYAMGIIKTVMFGSCGVLDADISEYSVIIPTAALRDEGTSYHYAPPSDEIEVNTLYINEFEKLLKDRGFPYMKGKTWTTDAVFRETQRKLVLRKSQGCVCVDMECSAAAAVTAFRGKELFHFFYAADVLSDEAWDMRNIGEKGNHKIRTEISMLALELALCMKKGTI